MLGQRFRLKLKKFLSTPSARRATQPRPIYPAPPGYFYPRPPRGGRLRESEYRREDRNFYPRPPRGGRQLAKHGFLCHVVISIHALREEGDCGLR